MGLVISWFRRKKTTTDVLEKLNNSIKSIEQRGQWTQLQHQRIISQLTNYAVGVYVIFSIIYYFKYTGESVSWFQSLTYATPFLALPVLVVLLRRLISWYYNRALSNNKIKLTKLKEEKKNILEKVMETETYKVAKEILDKYGDAEQQGKALLPFVPTTNVPATPGQLKQRQIAWQTSTPISANNSLAGNVSLRSPLKPDQLPHPLVPNRLTVLDKVINYFIKDGADNRFALICTNCSSHNGMILEELYEYTSYKCAYCGKFNPSRKQRPRAPPLAITPQRDPSLSAIPKRADTASSSSEDEDERNSGTESSVESMNVKPKSIEEKKED